MKLIAPDEKDVSDVHMAIRTFRGAWGSVDPFGDYKPESNGKTLWIMFKYDFATCVSLVDDFAPPKYASMFPTSLELGEGVLHAQASKIKQGFFGSAWLMKVTYLVNDATYPIGFLAASSQSSLWSKLHSALDFRDDQVGRFYLTAETALAVTAT